MRVMPPSDARGIGALLGSEGLAFARATASFGAASVGAVWFVQRLAGGV